MEEIKLAKRELAVQSDTGSAFRIAITLTASTYGTAQPASVVCC